LPALLIVILVLLLLFNPGLLPKIGSWLGDKSRRPVRQAKWVWSSFTGTEDEAIRAEREYGAECTRALAAQFRGKVAPEDQEFVNEIGYKLAGAVKDRRREFCFTVAGAAQANAYALPGGFIFVTGALLDLCNHNESEIAFILGHEIGHVLRNHARDHFAADAILKAVSLRMPAAGPMLQNVARKGYSRMQELEADQEAIKLTAAAGFDVRASVSALKRLSRAAPDPSGLAEYISSHPTISERVRELEKSLACTRES
jgi:predicted Zn-dependent protease